MRNKIMFYLTSLFMLVSGINVFAVNGPISGPVIPITNGIPKFISSKIITNTPILIDDSQNVSGANDIASKSTTITNTLRVIGLSNVYSLAWYGDSILAGIDATKNSCPIQTVELGSLVLTNGQATYTHDGYTGVLSGLFPGLGSIPIADAMLDVTNAALLPKTTIIMSGHNDGWNGAFPMDWITNQVATNIARMVAALGHSNYLVLPILRNTDWTNGTVEYQNTTNFNRYLSEVYQEHFVDYYPSFFVQAQDATDQAQTNMGSIPWRFYNVPAAGYIHLTDTGCRVLATNVITGLKRILRQTPGPAASVIIQQPTNSASGSSSTIWATSKLLLGADAGLVAYDGADFSVGYNPSMYVGANVGTSTRSSGTTKVWYMVSAPKTSGNYPQALISTYSDGTYGEVNIGGGNGSASAPTREVNIYAGTDGTALGAGTKIIGVTSSGASLNGVTVIASDDYGTTLSVDDTYRGNTRVGFNNSGGVTQWDAVYLNSSSQWVLADANGSGTYPCRGIAIATASTGAATTVITRGTIRNDAWTWTVGGNIYLSTTAGGLTQTAPSTTGDKIQVIGYALDADTMAVEISSDYGTAP